MPRWNPNRAEGRARPSVVIACLAGVAALLAATGCTLFAGQPWGEVELDLEVRLSISDDRLTDEGYWKTTRDFSLDPTVLEVDLGAIRLLAPAGTTGGTPTAFDPAAPPPGYSLCHNGHCHAEDGRLVDYAEVEAELTGGGGGGPVVVTGRSVRSRPVSLWPEVTPIELEDCPEGCLVGRGEVTSVEVSLTRFHYAMRVRDLRPADRARLPPEGVLVAGEVALGEALTMDLAERFDRDQPIGLRVDAAAVFLPTFFDGVDFDQVIETDPVSDAPYVLDALLSVTEAVTESLREDASLAAIRERFDPDPSALDIVLLPPPATP